jgi:glycosyltransferase involved in cell wall biosynthesis
MNATPKPSGEPVADTSMYVVYPVPFLVADGQMFIESQAGNGLNCWAEHFSPIIIAAPLIPQAKVKDLAGFVWRPVDSLERRESIICQALPYAYTPGKFLRHLRSTRRLIATSIAQSRYLQFGIGGLIGDWPAVAAMEAIRQGRKYGIHMDRVEHELLRKLSSSLPSLRRLKALIEVPLFERYHRYIINHCSLGLWHGDDCYRAYSPWCNENHLIHDVHTKEADLVSESDLRVKIQNALQTEVLDLCYVGRLDPMKAPLEWLRAIAVARDLGVRLHATWYGEGPLLEEAKAEAARLNLDDIVSYPGFVADRATLLNNLRSAHALVFTHVTPESPRNLLESLVSGTPILGYTSAYAGNLLAERGGGALVPMHDVQALGQLIVEMSRDRNRLVELTKQAAANGRRFTDTAVFAERSQLVKEYA